MSILKQQSETFSLDDILSSIKVDFKLESGFWSDKPKVAKLKLHFLHTRNEEAHPYEREWDMSWDLHSNSQKSIPDKLYYDDNQASTEFDRTLLEYTLGKIAAAGVALGNDVSNEELKKFRDETIRALATVTDRPAIMQMYEQTILQQEQENFRKSQEKIAAQQRKEEEAKKKAEEQRRASLEKRLQETHDVIRNTLVAYETEARYRVSVEANKEHDFNLPKGEVQRQTADLFERKNNLLSRPLFKEMPKGKWADFLKVTLGEMFYNKLLIVENDLDELYVPVLEKISKVALEQGGERIPTPAEYERTFVETHDLSHVLDVLEREWDVNVDLLERFKEKLIEKPLNHDLAFKKLLHYLGKDPFDYFTYSTAIAPFSFNYNQEIRGEEDFKVKVAQVIENFTSYLRKNKDKIVVEDTDSPIQKGKVVIVKKAIDDKVKKGSVGICDCLTRTQSGWRNPVISFSYMSNGAELLQCNISAKYLVGAKLVFAVYEGNLEKAAKTIVGNIASVAVKNVYNSSLEEQQKFIQQAHPCLEQEIAYRNKFFELMAVRFKEMYARHADHPKDLNKKSLLKENILEGGNR